MMRKGEFNLFLLMISLIIILGILLGGYFLYHKVGTEKPLVTQIAALESVDGAEVNVINKKYHINIYITGVDSIQKTYMMIDDLASIYLKDNDYEIKILDNRNQNLEDIYCRLQPAIYEALASNRYIWLQEEITRQFSDIGKFKLFIDENRVYLQLNQGEHFLYEIINRKSQGISMG